MIILLRTAKEIQQYLTKNGLTDVVVLTPNHRDDEIPYGIGFTLNGKSICFSASGNEADQWLNVDAEI